MSIETPQFIDFGKTALWVDTQVRTHLKAGGHLLDTLPNDDSRNVRHTFAVMKTVAEKKYCHAWSDKDEGNDKILRLGLAVANYDIDALSKEVMKQEWFDCDYMGPVGSEASEEIHRFELAAYTALHLTHKYGLHLIALQYSELYEN